MYWSDEVTLAEAAKLLDVSEADVLRLIQKQLLSARWQISERGQRVRHIKRDLVLALKDSGRYRSVLTDAPAASSSAAVLTLSAGGEAAPAKAGDAASAGAGSGGAADPAAANEFAEPTAPADQTMALQMLMQSTITLRELVVALAGQDEQQSHEVVQQVARLAERVTAGQEHQLQQSEAILRQTAADRENTRQVVDALQHQVDALAGAAAEQSKTNADAGAKLDELNASIGQLTGEVARLFEAVDATQQYLRDHFEGGSLAKLGKLGKSVIERKTK